MIWSLFFFNFIFSLTLTSTISSIFLYFIYFFRNNKNEPYSSNLGQILDKDMISDKYKNNENINERIRNDDVDIYKDSNNRSGMNYFNI
jgi:hypothetical protein